MKILLIASASVEVAAEIAGLVSGGGIEVHSLCPTRPEGFLRALSNRFSEADSILLTSDIFPETGLTSLIQQVRAANQNIQVLVLRRGGMETIDESGLRAAGASGVYSKGLPRDDILGPWIKRAVISGESSFSIERARSTAHNESPMSRDLPARKPQHVKAPTTRTVRPVKKVKPSRLREESIHQAEEVQPTVPVKEQRLTAPPKIDALKMVAANPLNRVWSPWVDSSQESPPPLPEAPVEAPQAGEVAALEMADSDEPTATTVPEVEDLIRGLKKLCAGVRQEVVLRALFGAAQTFVELLAKETQAVARREQEGAVPNALGDVYSISVETLSGKSALVKLGNLEFFMFPSHAEVLKKLVLAKGQPVSLEEIRSSFRMGHLHNARNIMGKVIESLNASAPQLRGFIRKIYGGKYYFAPPVV